jgi:hypothetical protein
MHRWTRWTFPTLNVTFFFWFQSDLYFDKQNMCQEWVSWLFHRPVLVQNCTYTTRLCDWRQAHSLTAASVTKHCTPFSMAEWRGNWRVQINEVKRPLVFFLFIEHQGRVVSTTASYSGGPGFKFRLGDRLYWPKFSWFSLVPPGKYRESTSN